MSGTTGRPGLGLLLGLVGVIAFSLTLPMTRVAVAELDAGVVAFGRMAVAGLIALPWLLLLRAPVPPRAAWPALAWTASGVVLGFPLFTSMAMTTLPAGQGAVVTGLLPLATAALAALMLGERLPARFWLCAAVGAALVVAFALRDGIGAHAAGYVWMLAAVGAGALGYALGGRAAVTLGGMRTILWVLVAALPLTLPLALWRVASAPPAGSAAAWAGFAYVTVVSQVLGFFAWYNGLAIGGVARVGQLQLLQVFFTLACSVALFHEPAPPSAWIVAVAVVATIVVGRSGPRSGGAASR